MSNPRPQVNGRDLGPWDLPGGAAYVGNNIAFRVKVKAMLHWIRKKEPQKAADAARHVARHARYVLARVALAQETPK